MIVNGDLIEGVHHKTKEVIHHDTGVHIATMPPFSRHSPSVPRGCFVTRAPRQYTGHTLRLLSVP